MNYILFIYEKRLFNNNDRLIAINSWFIERSGCWSDFENMFAQGEYLKGNLKIVLPNWSKWNLISQSLKIVRLYFNSCSWLIFALFTDPLPGEDRSCPGWRRNPWASLIWEESILVPQPISKNRERERERLVPCLLSYLAKQLGS